MTTLNRVNPRLNRKQNKQIDVLGLISRLWFTKGFETANFKIHLHLLLILYNASTLVFMSSIVYSLDYLSLTNIVYLQSTTGNQTALYRGPLHKLQGVLESRPVFIKSARVTPRLYKEC